MLGRFWSLSYGVGISIGFFLQDRNYWPPTTKALKKTAVFLLNMARDVPSCRCHYSPAITPLLANDQSTDSAALGGEYDIRYLSGNNCRGVR